MGVADVVKGPAGPGAVLQLLRDLQVLPVGGEGGRPVAHQRVAHPQVAVGGALAPAVPHGPGRRQVLAVGRHGLRVLLQRHPRVADAGVGAGLGMGEG